MSSRKFPPEPYENALLYWDVLALKPQDLAANIERFADEAESLGRRAVQRRRQNEGPVDETVLKFVRSSFLLAHHARKLATVLRDIGAETDQLFPDQAEVLTSALEQMHTLLAPLRELDAVLPKADQTP